MINDPIVDEIHRLREEHAAQYGFDLHAICEAIREEEKASGEEFITLPSRKPEAVSPVGSPLSGMDLDALPSS